jgi:hypothetical protein
MTACEECRHCLMTIGKANVVYFQCRRLPPAIAFKDDRLASGWPAVNSDDWCGEWEATK